MELTYDKGAEDFIFEALGLQLDKSGNLMYEDGGYVPTLCGKESIRVDKVGGYVHDETYPYDTAIMCDNFSCIVSHQVESEEWDDPRNP